MHVPVLLKESIDALDVQAGETFLDGTLGGGGHSIEVLRRLDGKVRIIGLDRDQRAIESTRNRLNIEAKAESFRHLDKVLEELGVSSVDAILFDLGISTDQFEESGRGFSFLKDEPLDMRMSASASQRRDGSGQGITAADILNSWDEEAIELVLRGFGEEKFSRKIARVVVERRKIKPFKTTFDLVGSVLEVKPRSWRDRIHPATKTFQALRIAVNEELTALETGLEIGFKALAKGGRFAVISFHSLEDRIVKNFFRDKIKEKVAGQITKKPIMPNAEEIETNPRSRSAKLRVIKKL